ncbi:quinone oxidoreductase-like protein [Sarcoptes scabiei]|uniref:15-oxoprostaglandin 13-reductase n=1 Tax=Sarcoptes scabiei TaxID=52283 RepID=A0A132AHF1_SARSC|nr:quinone oxidoreductase-like protein [Sarcoptes scabiei]
MSKVFNKLQVFTKTPNFREAVKLVTKPLIEPKDDEVRVKIIYTGLNATDINITAARYFTDGKIPFDIGLEGLGLIDAVGSKVEMQPNTPVMVMKSQNSDCFSEYVYATKKELIPLPDLRPNYLVSAVNGLTASIALDKKAFLKENEKILVTAAAGGTGQIVVQWAKKCGAYVIAMTSSDAKSQMLKSLGADFIINYRTENVSEVLQKNFPQGVDVVWETIGGETMRTLFNHLAVRGRMVLIGAITNYSKDGNFSVPIDDLNLKLLMGSKSLVGFMLPNYSDSYPEYLPKLIGMIANGSIQANVDLGENTAEGKFFGLDQIARAEEHLHSGKNIGKVVVQIQEA